MKNALKLSLLVLLSFAFMSSTCSTDDDDDDGSNNNAAEITTIENNMETGG